MTTRWELRLGSVWIVVFPILTRLISHHAERQNQLHHACHCLQGCALPHSLTPHAWQVEDTLAVQPGAGAAGETQGDKGGMESGKVRGSACMTGCTQHVLPDLGTYPSPYYLLGEWCLIWT